MAAAVATTSSEPARTVRLGHDTDTASSAVFVVEDGVVFGDAAVRRALAAPERLVRGAVDRIGDAVPLNVGGRSLRPEDVYAGIVEWAAATASAEPPASVTVIVPATWGPHRRGSVSRALRARGVDADLVSAPEAIAHGRLVAAGRSGTFAVYDLGAAACDLAVVCLADGVAEVRAVTSLPDLGGADFDDAVMRHIEESTPLARPASALARGMLRRACTEAKEALSFDVETVVPVIAAGGEALVRLVRDEFEAAIEPGIRRTLAALDDLLEDAGVDPDALAGIVLTGGGSRIPRVAQLLSEHHGVPLLVDGEPQSLAARGAALAAAARASADAEAAAPIAPAPAAEAADTAPPPGMWRRLRRWLAAADDEPASVPTTAADTPAEQPAEPDAETPPTRRTRTGARAA